jgi:hypothetical protein
MAQPRPWYDDAEEEKEANRQTASLAGVAVTLLLLVIGLFLVHTLAAESKVEDCLLSGRRNCDLLVTGPATNLFRDTRR